MTEKRIFEIYKENMPNDRMPTMGDTLKAMKQAVNESIQECADNVDKYGPYLNQNGGTRVITNLKVK